MISVTNLHKHFKVNKHQRGLSRCVAGPVL